MGRRIRILPRFWRFILVLLAISFAIAALTAQIKYRRGCAHLAEIRLERNAQSEQVDALRRRLDYVQSDAYVERVAREELNLIYPGELRYVAR